MLYLLNNIAAILAILIYHIYIYKKRRKNIFTNFGPFRKGLAALPHEQHRWCESRLTGHPCTSRSIRTPSLQVVLPSDLLERVSPAVGPLGVALASGCLLMGMPYMGIIILTYSYCVHIYRYIVIIVIIVVWMCGNPSAMAIIQTPPWNTPILRSISSPSPPKKLCFWVVFSINGGMGGMGLVSFEQLQPRWTHEEPEIVSHFHVLV